jgi:hypothetical protein
VDVDLARRALQCHEWHADLALGYVETPRRISVDVSCHNSIARWHLVNGQRVGADFHYFQAEIGINRARGSLSLVCPTCRRPVEVRVEPRGTPPLSMAVRDRWQRFVKGSEAEKGLAVEHYVVYCVRPGAEQWESDGVHYADRVNC